MLSTYIVIRTVGERSLPLCIGSVQEQKRNYQIVSISPFIRAVQKTFELGLNRPDDLLLAVDADIILKPEIVQQIESKAEELLTLNPNLFRIDLLLSDKFRGHIAGCHVYVNEYSAIFADYFKNVKYDPTERRPESKNIALCRKKHGLSSIDLKLEVGTHDFEQYYKHIFVKYYNRAVRDMKSYDKIRQCVASKAEKYPEDKDFLVALRGLEAGRGQVTMRLDASAYPDVTNLLASMGLTEKRPL